MPFKQVSKADDEEQKSRARAQEILSSVPVRTKKTWWDSVTGFFSFRIKKREAERQRLREQFAENFPHIVEVRKFVEDQKNALEQVMGKPLKGVRTNLAVAILAAEWSGRGEDPIAVFNDQIGRWTLDGFSGKKAHGEGGDGLPQVAWEIYGPLQKLYPNLLPPIPPAKTKREEYRNFVRLIGNPIIGVRALLLNMHENGMNNQEFIGNDDVEFAMHNIGASKEQDKLPYVSDRGEVLMNIIGEDHRGFILKARDALKVLDWVFPEDLQQKPQGTYLASR